MSGLELVLDGGHSILPPYNPAPAIEADVTAWGLSSGLRWTTIGRDRRSPNLVLCTAGDQGVGATNRGAFECVPCTGAQPTMYGSELGALGVDEGAARDDLVALMDAVGIERAHLAGMSMGAAVCQEVAIRYPDRVRPPRPLQHLGPYGYPTPPPLGALALPDGAPAGSRSTSASAGRQSSMNGIATFSRRTRSSTAAN